ncbi:MAG: guanylate kinase [Gammaproteobacteria bacterium]|nr:guanylate kinase [Gammaproteobacteria bacterium]
MTQTGATSRAKTGGTLFILSAPSGAGKTSLVKALLKEIAGIAVSISHTTRAQRPGERDGVDYHFVTLEGFKHLLDTGAFLESAQVFDNYYGTSAAAVLHQLASGQDVILEIDWQGAEQVRQRFEGAVSIFILPPSKVALRERLTQRGQDDEQVIDRRMHDAEAEISHFAEFDYIVVNDRFELALAELQAIVTACRLRIRQQAPALASLTAELQARIG